MLKPEALLHPTPAGRNHIHHRLHRLVTAVYCPPGDFYIGPVRPVARAVITHGHADHARAGHDHVAATPQTLDIMGVRYGEAFAGASRPLAYGETIERDGVEITLVPAGHVQGAHGGKHRVAGFVDGVHAAGQHPVAIVDQPAMEVALLGCLQALAPLAVVVQV
eukprot:gene52302-71317_t